MESSLPFVPLGRDHALKQVVLGVSLNEPLPAAAMEQFRSPILKEELPAHVIIEGQEVALRVGPDANVAPAPALRDTGIERVEFQRFDNGGSLEWQLGIEKERLFVASYAYTRWEQISARAYAFLDAVFRLLQAYRTTANSVVAEWTDEFFSTAPPEDGAKTLLRADVGWLAPEVMNSIGLFHSNVGWFERPSEADTDVRRLVRINIEALPLDRFDRVPPGSHFGVRITTFLRVDPLSQPFALLMAEGGPIHSSFEAMHLRSNELIKALLTEEMKLRIGLT